MTRNKAKIDYRPSAELWGVSWWDTERKSLKVRSLSFQNWLPTYSNPDTARHIGQIPCLSWRQLVWCLFCCVFGLNKRPCLQMNGLQCTTHLNYGQTTDTLPPLRAIWSLQEISIELYKSHCFRHLFAWLHPSEITPDTRTKGKSHTTEQIISSNINHSRFAWR